MSNVRVAPTTADTRGGDHARSAADARYLIAKLLGVHVPTGPLAAAAHQESPPVNPQPATVNPGHVDLGAVAAGSGTLSAHTTWRAGPHCPPSPGPTAQAKASVLDATVLPALNGALAGYPATRRVPA